MKITTILMLTLISVVYAQLPQTDSPLGIVDDGTSVPLPTGAVRVPASEALARFQRTTDTLTTITLTRIVFNEESATTTAITLVRPVWRRVRWPLHFVYRLRDNYWRDPNTSKFYKLN